VFWQPHYRKLPELHLVDLIMWHISYKLLPYCGDALSPPGQSHSLVQQGPVTSQPAEAVGPRWNLGQHM
jgi:hypothetical protein